MINVFIALAAIISHYYFFLSQHRIYNTNNTAVACMSPNYFVFALYCHPVKLCLLVTNIYRKKVKRVKVKINKK